MPKRLRLRRLADSYLEEGLRAALHREERAGRPNLIRYLRRAIDRRERAVAGLEGETTHPAGRRYADNMRQHHVRILEELRELLEQVG